jgi:tRNA A-37 threonylcarbamoyl transferase component Bud32
MDADVPFSESEHIPGTPYQVVCLVGVGGMAFVYEVEHQIIGKRFMLKALRGDMVRRPGFAERLRREWLALGKLEHPNVVRVWNAGILENGVPFFAMDYLEGETLHAALARDGLFRVEDALRIAHAVLLGLGAVHDIGVIHCDVNPKNVFLTRDGGVKLLDFGIASVPDADGAEPSEGTCIGTPRYTSPEQVAGERPTAAADLYSLGLVLFEMLAGRSPFEATKRREWLWCHLDEVPPPCSELAPQPISPPLDALIASLLAKDPRSRPPSAHAAAERVTELMGTDETLIDVDERIFEQARDRAMMVDADATLPGTPEAIAAIRGFRALQRIGDPLSDPAASAEPATPTGLVVAPRRLPVWWPWALVGFGGALLAGMGWIGYGLVALAEGLEARDRRDATAAEAARRETARVVASTASVRGAPVPAPSASVAAGPAPSSSVEPKALRPMPKKASKSRSANRLNLPSAGLDDVVGTPPELPSAWFGELVAKPKATAKKKAAVPRGGASK